MVLGYEKNSVCTITYGILVKYGILERYFFRSTEYGKPFRTVPNALSCSIGL